MYDRRFEWDDDEAAANLRKHRISFDEARAVFDDLLAIEDLDPDPDEERTATIGMAGGNLLVVISTERDGRIRIVSARRATKAERRRYEDGE